MKTDRKKELLDKIQKMRQAAEEPTAAVATAQTPERQAAIAVSDSQPTPEDLDAIVNRINSLTSQIATGTATDVKQPLDCNSGDPQLVRAVTGQPTPAAAESSTREDFFPKEVRTLEEAGLTNSIVEELVLKYLLSSGEDSGQGISDQLKLPFNIITQMLRRLKQDQIIHYRDTATLNDYVCSLTETGRERARRLSLRCTYYGAAPVSLQDYCAAVAAQSLTRQRPTEEDLKRAFSDLMINPKMLLKLGTALNSGRGMFLYGYPGNGKTSIAERVTRAFGETIWIPRSVGVDGEIIRLFDPSQHEVVPLDLPSGILHDQKSDARWVRIKRPTIIVGGELTMDNLELTLNEATGINEAPVQMKSNCGTLVIDDFGRQRMTTDELLNRWIVPLEKRYDFLNLASGKKIQVPFDQLIIFSTNLEPKDLVDDAFLRRIPYKIEVENPSEEEFRKLFQIMCPKMGFDSTATEHRLPDRDALRTDQPPVSLLPSTRPVVAGEELLPVPSRVDDPDAGESGLRLRQLLLDRLVGQRHFLRRHVVNYDTERSSVILKEPQD